MQFLPLDSYDEVDWFGDKDLYLKARDVALRSGGLICEDCGIKSKSSAELPFGMMEFHAIDDVVRILCPLCHAGLHVDHHLNARNITLVAAPWISQSALNCSLWAVMGAADDQDSLYYNDANVIYEELLTLQSGVPGLIPTFPGNESFLESNFVLLLDVVKTLGMESSFIKQIARDVRFFPKESFKPEAVDYIYKVQCDHSPAPAKWGQLLCQ